MRLSWRAVVILAWKRRYGVFIHASVHNSHTQKSALAA